MREEDIYSRIALDMLKPAVRRLLDEEGLIRSGVSAALLTLATDVALEQIPMAEVQAWLRRCADELPDNHKLPSHKGGTA
jgi:hypothetical protein